MAALTIRNLKKSFGAFHVLKDVSIEAPDGAFVVLVGPSGCGKSTLLRLIAGLEEASAGELLIGERLVNDVEPKARDIAMVFQSYALYPQMSVAQNMGFALKLARTPRERILEAITPAARMLGLEDQLTKLPRQLSGGQRQRVAMGRAIVRDPKLFLFDEPLSNLDAKLRVHMRAEIKSLHRRLGTTTIYVTHDQIEAMTMADLIVVMDGGRVSQMGRPLELYDRPDNLFVAAFIGSPTMNLLAGRIDNGTFFSQAGTQLPLPDPLPAGADNEITLGVRPQHVALVEGDTFEVTNVEQTGSETFLILANGADEISVVSKERSSIAIGDRTGIAIQPGHTHVFDTRSGQRLENGTH